jgi:transposase
VQSQLDALLGRVTSLETRCHQLEDENSALRSANLQLRRENVRLTRENTKLRDHNTRLASRVTGLEAKLLLGSKDSTTSSKPPSTDDPTQRSRRYVDRPKSDRLPGGQAGHTGAGRDWVESPDQVVVHEPDTCKGCGGGLAGVAVLRTERRQLTDVQVSTTVTEHQASTKACPQCGTKTKALFPREVVGTVCFGPGVRAAVLALSAAGKLPSRVAADLAAALFDIHIAPAVVDHWRRGLASSLLDWDNAVVELLKAAPVVGADESPVAVDGMANAHAHVTVTELLTRFFLAGRTKADIISGGVLEDHPGRLVTDCHGTYWHIGVASHQACVGHLKREVDFFDKNYTPVVVAGRDTPKHPYPQFAAIHLLLQEAVHLRNEQAPSGVPPGIGRQREALKKLTDSVELAFSARPRLNKTDRAARALCRRLNRLAANDELFTFLEDLSVPPTNNWSEQPLRPWKVRQRRSGCFRSRVAAQEWLRIAGYLDTSRKHGTDPIEAIRLAVVGTPVMP